jgi:glycosyltransferase involved in cell wall biosynthesis
MQRIEVSPLRENLIYLGSRADIPDVLASFDVFFLPTRAEPFGMVVIEAMASGLPVVASRVGGIPEIITSPDIGRTVSEPTPAAYAGAIADLLQMGAGIKALGERGRDSLSGRFDLAKMGATLSAVYQDMANS